MNEDMDDEDFDIRGEYVDAETDNTFASLIDFDTNRLYPEIIVAKIPTDKPWEAAAWVPMGGFKVCVLKCQYHDKPLYH